MLVEPGNQFSLTRAASSTSGRENQILISNMKKPLFLVVSIIVLAALTILIQGCSSLGKLPSGKDWYKPGASAEQTQYDWVACQMAVLRHTLPQSIPSQVQTVPSPPLISSTAVQPNAYGLGVNADEYGRPTTYQLQNGQQLDPIFYGGVKQNVYGLGVGADQFGRPVYNAPYGNNVGQGNNWGQENNGGQQSDLAGRIALNMLSAMQENHIAKQYMKAKGYYLVSTNSPLIKNRQLHGF